MAKNFMHEIAKMLGVELGEEFIIENKDRKETVVLAADGFHVIQPNNVMGPDHGKLLSKVLQGLYEVKKKPWVPNFGEPYWTISFSTNFTVRVIKKAWEKECVDFALLRLSMVYRTMQEAESHMAEDYQRLTDKPLSSR